MAHNKVLMRNTETSSWKEEKNMNYAISESGTNANSRIEEAIPQTTEKSTIPGAPLFSKKAIKPVNQSPSKEKIEARLLQLRDFQNNHSLWNNSLFAAFKAGRLSIGDLRFVFGQYSFYSQNFTRYLAGFMANSDNDMHRAQLVENLWEESGETDLNQRHTMLFRCFLIQGLGIRPDDLTATPATQVFVNEILSFCLRSPACESSAFLSLGTEGIVPRMYTIFIQGLQKAGVADEHLTFFHLHTTCDDEHAVTLEKIMLSYASEPGWFETCRRSLAFALDLREQFFERIYQQIQVQRIESILTRIQARKSLAEPQQKLHYHTQQPGKLLYQNKGTWGKQSIDFRVERLALPSEVLDHRLLHIAPNKMNERHRHAHEALFIIKTGKGIVWIEQKQIDIEIGDVVFIPRWVAHQVQNTGDDPLCILAITDFGLTSKAFIGDYLKTARLQVTQDKDYARL